MGRSPLGAAARTLSVTVKVSENEKALLKGWGYKSPGLAARQALDALIAQRQLAAGGPVVPIVAPGDDLDRLERAIGPLEPAQVSTPCRIHRSYEVVKEWHEFGNRWVTKVCRDCGYENTVQEGK